jgi:membrane-associated phospholipid phosphatase
MRITARCVAPLAIACSVLGAPAAVRGQASRDAPAELKPLQNTGTGFLALETAGALMIFASYGVVAGGPRPSCDWCDPNGFDEALRARLVLGKASRKAAGIVSHVFSAGIVPASVFTALLVPAVSEGKGSYALQDAWIMLNTVLLTTGISEGTKRLVARRRPAFHYGEQDHNEFGDNLAETNLSFFSGDTAWAFSFAASGSTLAFFRGNRWAPFIAFGGGTLALGTGFLRIASDAHWTTDVLAGALVGTGVGVAMPLLLHRRAGDAPVLRVSPWMGRATGVELAFAF